ncbi:MAG: hypothetical protein C4323_15080 [Mastigocladus sp. ERB_26_2]
MPSIALLSRLGFYNSISEIPTTVVWLMVKAISVTICHNMSRDHPIKSIFDGLRDPDFFKKSGI